MNHDHVYAEMNERLSGIDEFLVDNNKGVNQFDLADAVMLLLTEINRIGNLLERISKEIKKDA